MLCDSYTQRYAKALLLEAMILHVSIKKHMDSLSIDDSSILKRNLRQLASIIIAFKIKGVKVGDFLFITTFERRVTYLRGLSYTLLKKMGDSATISKKNFVPTLSKKIQEVPHLRESFIYHMELVTAPDYYLKKKKKIVRRSVLLQELFRKLPTLPSKGTKNP